MREIFEQEGIRLTEDQEKKFRKYLDFILATPFNITSIKSPDLIVYRHFIDSLKLTSFLDLTSFNLILDIGTGAGFPGIPLKIVSPHLSLTLLESSRKKVSFLNSLILALGIDDIKIVWARAEDFGKIRENRELYDLVVIRALAHLRILLELSLPFLKVGGILVAYKGKNVRDELKEAQNALKILGGKLEKVQEYRIGGIDFRGNLVFIRKELPTSIKYPRRAGIPFKRPL